MFAGCIIVIIIICLVIPDPVSLYMAQWRVKQEAKEAVASGPTQVSQKIFPQETF